MVSTASSLLVGKLRQGAGKSPAWQCQPARKRSGSSAGVIALVRECCPWEENMRTLLNVIHVVVFWKFPTPCKIVKIVGFFRKKEASLSQRIVLGVQKCLFLQKKTQFAINGLWYSTNRTVFPQVSYLVHVCYFLFQLP